ncbi:MAG: double-strand break repair protein AddB [Acetobacter sp.]|nr:double-strand break repair protein AddB [Acetobacter sp.]
MTLSTIPAHLPFLDILAKQWIAHFNHDTLATGDGTILLPGRRAARVLKEAFLRQTNGKTILLPRIIPIGALGDSETEITLSQISTAQNVIDLPPAIGSITRLATLTRMILAADSAFHNQTLEQAWFLAQSLADLMDEAERMGIDLHEQLPHAVQEDFAKHWQHTLRFLSIVTQHWPKWLHEQGAMNPVARQVALVRKQAALWRQQAVQAPEHPLWAAGFTHALPPTIEALSAILSHPQGRIIFPGLDKTTPNEIFDKLPDSHPQAGIRDLLRALNISRSDVIVWPVSNNNISERTTVLSQMMLPSEVWNPSTHQTLPDVSSIEVRNEQEEAVAISMAIRDALETPDKKIALITPDRKLAQRVITELERWEIHADDSAGTPLSDTPPTVFLRLITQAIDNNFAPVDLLALLKHPLVACGLEPKKCRDLTRRLERTILRGQTLSPGFEALKKSILTKIENAKEKASLEKLEELKTFIERVETCLAPVLSWQNTTDHPPPQKNKTAPLPKLLENLLETAEALAQTNTEEAVPRLWQGEEGNSLADLLSDLITATDILPQQPYTALKGLLKAVLSQAPTIRRGDPFASHPRVMIWGLREARLQTADTVILAGLSEGIWPPVADTGPWINLPMRQKIGLASPEQKIGEAAHDFFMAVTAAQNVVLSSTAYRENEHVIPARWITRIKVFLAGHQQQIPSHPAQKWVTQLDSEQCAKSIKFKEPYPKPKTEQRPRKINVTEVETWLRDPYAIYARHILNFEPLSPLQEETDAQDFGNIVHKVLEQWVNFHKNTQIWTKENACTCLKELFEDTIKKYNYIHPSRYTWWKPRFLRIAQWIAEQETQNSSQVTSLAEVRGEIDIPNLPGGHFKLVGRADRIEYSSDGFTILDYKTGQLPLKKSVEKGWCPQLLLEAAMVQKGAFKEIPEQNLNVNDLIYWRLKGDKTKGEIFSFKEKLDLPIDLSDKVNALWEKFLSRIKDYDNPETPYCSHPFPGEEPRFAKYKRLARVDEWRAPDLDNATNNENE